MSRKLERQNQHKRKLKKKIEKFEKKGWNTDGLKKELSYCTSELDRPTFLTGHHAGDEKAQMKFAMQNKKLKEAQEKDVGHAS